MFEDAGLVDVRLPRALRAVGRRAFAGCKNLRSIALEASALEEVGAKAFFGSGLECFVAQPSLRTVGDLAFGACAALKDFRLSEGVREPGWLCLWGTAVTSSALSQHVRRMSEQFGAGQNDPRLVRLPDGLEVVGERWFEASGVEKVTVSSSVKTLGKAAFAWCRQLREVVFEPGSRLEVIGDHCFRECGFETFLVPQSVRVIGNSVFYDC